MALNPNALTTVDRVKKHLRRNGITDAAGDELLELYINAYSNAIAAYCDRRFKPTETAVSKTFRYDGSGYLNLAPYELRALTLLEFDSDTVSPYFVLSSDYRLEPRGSDLLTGTYLWVSLPRLDRGAWPGNLPTPLDREVRITGDWGPASVPSDVELACVIACANAFRNPEGTAQRAGGGGMDFGEEDFGGEAPGVGLSLPQDARAILGPYRRGGGL